MQKVLRRTALAKAQAKRKARIAEEGQLKVDRGTFQQRSLPLADERRKAVAAERYRRREDWELGPLSPFRNRFDDMLRNGFGAFTSGQLQIPDKPKAERIKRWMIKLNDRVCVIKGHETIRGRIGEVREVNKENETVVLRGVHTMKIQYNQKLQPDVYEVPVRYEDVRLVYPLPDPVTGVPRDCIIHNLVTRNRHFDVYENEEVFERWAEPQHIRIPWPEKDKPRETDNEVDTLRIASEENTFLPTLLRPPMPLTVIDELRNKYSVFRDRHEEDYIQKKMDEDAAQDAREAWGKAMLPRGARNIARTGRGTGSGPVELSDELAAKIGAHMAANGIKNVEGQTVVES